MFYGGIRKLSYHKISTFSILLFHELLRKRSNNLDFASSQDSDQPGSVWTQADQSLGCVRNG